MKRLLLTAIAVLAIAPTASATITSSESARLAAAGRVVQDIRTEISPDLWKRARCVIVIPELRKAAFIFGGEYGKGVISCRSADGWSAPAFLQLAKGSFGVQVGAEQIDLVMLVMNEQGVQKLLDNKVTLGVDAAVAAGPTGRQAQASTDAYLSAEILSYSRAQGLFAGIDVSGGILRPDDDANEDVYGANARLRTILAMREISAPTQAASFLSALRSLEAVNDRAPVTSGSSSVASSDPARPVTITPATSDSDLRSRVIDAQQTLNRILSDSAPSPVGTSGTSGSTITTDRARLLQLRDQLDALLRAVEK
jgi:SH3 domain-containing YSC84-like protein 1